MTERVARTRNRWGQGERLRVEILDAASRLLSELGDEEGLSIRGVARATGIAPASIYPHFGDRDALMEGLLEHESARLLALLERAAAEVDGDPVGRVRAQLYAYCDFAVANPGHYRILFRRRLGAAENSPSRPLQDIVSRFVTSFQRCESAGYRLRLPSQRAGTVAFVSVHGRVALLHANPTERNGQMLRPFVDELLTLIIE